MIDPSRRFSRLCIVLVMAAIIMGIMGMIRYQSWFPAASSL
jgi:hypothetical protein